MAASTRPAATQATPQVRALFLSTAVILCGVMAGDDVTMSISPVISPTSFSTARRGAAYAFEHQGERLP